MKRQSPFLFVLVFALAIASCKSSQKFQASTAEDKPLFTAINTLKKKPGHAQAQADLKMLYQQAVTRHKEAFDVYSANSDDEQRWDKMLRELNALQHIYNSLEVTAGTSGIVKPKSYLRDIETVKNQAAEFYYNRGNESMAEEGRASMLLAYDYFRKAAGYVSGYKDVQKLMSDAYQQAIVNVVINPIEENNIFFSGMGWNFPDFRYRPQDYQESLVRELGGKAANIVPARFYTDREIRRDGIRPDVEVNIAWRNIDPLRTIPYQYNRQASRNVEISKDTSGKPVYQTVYATLYVTQQTYVVRGDLEYETRDLNEQRTIDHGILNDEVSWIESIATYTGDSRALSQDDWMLVNSRSFNNPTKGDILNSLIRKIYPELRRRLQSSIQ